ncbi:hypothetical protein ACR2Q2_18070 [Pectobacterium versatile]|uniref:hypothetical protein n=1 Tax=Pectobacterium TaxID=122277 RepID=UPI000A9C700D|nr:MULTISPECIES: hypothetical protein [Pectobacterium]MBQ4778529.1 hypothetical protein [Pectobacterium versatile]MBQ4790817.1 hypothetical protein [Pectobacterium versatile]MCA5931486.1 hypothetical protein [Pectobacterium versatile]MCA5948575.1 hypothetical protein [Pectobacterium versatile]MCA5952846.1 hypothetical protein [Pectobacterium versatile]
MVHLLKMVDKQKKPMEQNVPMDNAASLNKVESLVERRKSILQSKAREKVLSASSKLNW